MSDLRPLMLDFVMMVVSQALCSECRCGRPVAPGEPFSANALTASYVIGGRPCTELVGSFYKRREQEANLSRLLHEMKEWP